MGLSIKDLVSPKEITIEELAGKKLAVDSFNLLYQFLTTIRQPDGTPLMNSKGQVTSHLNGLFNRTVNLIQKGIKLAFVFDGEPPKLKTKERERRAELKKEALKQYEIAKDREDIEGMKKYASRTTRLTPEMIEEAKELITAMGMPIVQAPSEGEAQAAHMVKKGDCYATVSQDFDTLLYESSKLIRNLSISGRRKSKLGFAKVMPEQISLSEFLNDNGIDSDKLIILGILVGTDYNIGGVKGIGPKKALKLVTEFDDFERIFNEVKWEFDVPWMDIYYTFKNMPVTDDYSLEWNEPDVDRIRELLVGKYEFSAERVENALSKIIESKQAREQKGLGEFF